MWGMRWPTWARTPLQAGGVTGGQGGRRGVDANGCARGCGWAGGSAAPAAQLQRQYVSQPQLGSRSTLAAPAAPAALPAAAHLYISQQMTPKLHTSAAGVSTPSLINSAAGGQEKGGMPRGSALSAAGCRPLAPGGLHRAGGLLAPRLLPLPRAGSPSPARSVAPSHCRSLTRRHVAAGAKGGGCQLAARRHLGEPKVADAGAEAAGIPGSRGSCGSLAFNGLKQHVVACRRGRGRQGQDTADGRAGQRR